jgi:hypothetical protein
MMEHGREQASAIEVTVAHSPLAVIYRLFTPTIEINGRKERRSWGRHRFQVPTGDYEISVSYPWLFSKECGKNTVRCRVEAGQVRQVKYRAGLIRYVPGRMTVA